MYSAEIKHIKCTKTEPDFDEACVAFFNWKDAVAESAEEYNERIRKVKLLSIVRSIIENELTKEQSDMLRLRYLDNKSGEEIAAMYGVTRSTVSRNLMKINEIFKTRMKYVFEYADSDIRNEVFPACIEQALAVMSVGSSKPELTGERLRKARLRKAMTTSLAADISGVPQKRIEDFENGGPLNVAEFVRLITAYKISADEAIFGV